MKVKIKNDELTYAIGFVEKNMTPSLMELHGILVEKNGGKNDISVETLHSIASIYSYMKLQLTVDHGLEIMGLTDETKATFKSIAKNMAEKSHQEAVEKFNTLMGGH